MKRFMLLTALFWSVFALAQEEELLTISKGTWEATGSFGLQYTDFENKGDSISSDGFVIIVLPEIGYAISDNCTLGAGIGYSYQENTARGEDIFDNQSTSNGFFFLGYIRRYLPVSKNFAFYLQGRAQYGFDNTESITANPEDQPTTVDSNNFGVSVGPGITYFVSDKFAFRANMGSLRYSSNTRESSNQDETKTNRIGFSLNPSNFNVGLSYFWN